MATEEPIEAVRRPKHGLTAAMEAARHRVAAEQDDERAAQEVDAIAREQLARKVDDLIRLQTDVLAALQIIDQRLTAIENRMTKPEAEKTQIITEARSAATTHVAAGELALS
jgi:hypothetical protein